MSGSNFRRLLTLLPIILSFNVAMLPSVAAQTKPLNNPNANATLPPPKDGTPDDTAGGSSRDGGYCTQDNIAEGSRGFSIAMPAYTETNSERPIFSVYIPQTTAKKVFFTLKDADEEYYYKTTISLPDQSGQFRFQLPSDAPTIKMNKEYTWSVGLVCQQAFDPNDPTLTGVIKRVEHNQVTGNSNF